MIDEDEVPPLDPLKVAIFLLLIGLIGFGGWRLWRARAAVAAVEASKDYRGLFHSRSAAAEASPPKRVVSAEGPRSGITMLRNDDVPREPEQLAAPEPPRPPAAPPAEDAPVAAVKLRPVPPAKREVKAFNQPRLNSGAFSGLNGGSGISYSGPAASGGKAPEAAPVIPAIPPATPP